MRTAAAARTPSASGVAAPSHSTPQASAVPSASRASRPAGTRQAPPRGRLALVPPMSAHAPRAPFVVLVASLLVAGLGGLLFLHTALAEDSFRLHDLQVRSALLEDREQALEQRIALEASPPRLAAQARALGMVRSENPAFIRLSDGRILGKPKAGVAPPPPPAPTSQPTGSPTSSATGSATGSGSATPSSGASSPGSSGESSPRSTASGGPGR